MNQDNMLLRNVPQGERPRERLMRYGPENMSNIELISLLLRTGSKNESVVTLAQRVLRLSGGLKGLVKLSYRQFSTLHGIGPAKAVQLIAGIELGRRVTRIDPEKRHQIFTPSEAAHIVMEELRYEQQEQFICVFLDTKNGIIDKKVIFKGTLNASVVHPREVYSAAIMHNSASIVCFHNHPSGDPTPSSEDIEITQKLYRAGEIVGIELIDHVIIGDLTYFSMKEKGFLCV